MSYSINILCPVSGTFGSVPSNFGTSESDSSNCGTFAPGNSRFGNFAPWNSTLRWINSSQRGISGGKISKSGISGGKSSTIGRIRLRSSKVGRNRPKSSRYRAQNVNRIRHDNNSTKNIICIKTNLKSEQLEGSGLKIPNKNRSPPKAAPGVMTRYFQNTFRTLRTPELFVLVLRMYKP